jgi:hypothetical protein
VPCETNDAIDGNVRFQRNAEFHGRSPLPQEIPLPNNSREELKSGSVA